ncbi:DUF2267 domain-containing protein [Rhizobium sp. AC44/96]|uniref:DUF2267 domain-containing protein n=1 Tax=Rhizobium sp. AC44/96 TaxID=1841654 RepID=UPI0009F65145|nr:DUF2267 domain-containing protein [Rhizobium sp. AC44/96]
MRYSPILTFPDAAQQATVWIRELSELLGCEQRVAYEVLRTILHGVRDRLSVDDNAKVGNDLPMMLRGLYFEAWDPMKSQGHDDLHDLPALLNAALPRSIVSDAELFPKVLKLFEARLPRKRSNKLDIALRLCATTATIGNQLTSVTLNKPPSAA